jgi:hypothetical protein
MTQLRTNLIAYINKLLIKTLEFYSKCYISEIHWVSAGENRNLKPNPINFGYPNLKIVGEKSNPNPKPLDPKPADIHPEPAPLPFLVTVTVTAHQFLPAQLRAARWRLVQ